MASLRRDCAAGAATLAAAVMMMMMMWAGGAVSGDVSVCPDADTPLVYPYWSTCFLPAVYGGEEVYQLRAVQGSGLLAPEWDETNSTYYLRLADEGATYALYYTSTESSSTSSYVTQAQEVLLVNADTARIVSWREEGDGEFFLVEEDLGNATFRLAANDGVALACPRILTARCQAYSLVDSTTSSTTGVTSYLEDGVTYFTRGSDLLPFVLLRTSSSTTRRTHTSKSVQLPTGSLHRSH